MNLNTFITNNEGWLLLLAVILFFALVGYIVGKTEFGKKAIEKSKQTVKDATKSDERDSASVGLNGDVPKVGLLDALSPNFNNGELMVGDVNQNPNKTNEELGINEDLYVPFGDASIENLEIEEVTDESDFEIIEKEKNKHESEVFGENEEDLSVPIEEVTIEEVVPEFNPEELVIEEFDVADQEFEKPDPIVEEISDLVDNTYVINDATEDFAEMTEVVEEDKTTEAEKEVTTESKIKQFKIEDDDSLSNEPSDFEIEQTTNLKLDEINEQIKNLKLEDSDAPVVEEPKTPKKPKKAKKVTVKTVEEIKSKKDNLEQEKKLTENSDIELPNLEDIASKNEDIKNEEDDVWKF